MIDDFQPNFSKAIVDVAKKIPHVLKYKFTKPWAFSSDHQAPLHNY
jgi:hypothetical protein